MEFRYIDRSLRNEWENLVKSNPASGFMQSFFWTEFKQLLGWETFKIGLFDNNKLIGGAIVSKYSHFKNFNFLFIPEGPVLPYEKKDAEKMFHLLISEIDQIAVLKDSEQLSSHLSIEPKLIKKPKYFSRFEKAPIDQQPLKTLIIDLTLSENDLLKQMKPKGRYNIKIAQKNKVEIIETNLKEGLNDFLILYNSFVKRSDFKGKDDSYFESLAYVLKNDLETAKFYFAKYNNKLIAAALVIYFGKTATFLYGAMNEKYKKIMASYLLQWEIIRHAKQKGFEQYDLYSLAPVDDASHPWCGFSVFKKKFGGEEVKYVGGYNYIYNKKLYKEYLIESNKE